MDLSGQATAQQHLSSCMPSFRLPDDCKRASPGALTVIREAKEGMQELKMLLRGVSAGKIHSLAQCTIR